ncbi:hypothetical protein ACWZUH_000024 [Campylobacter fetus]
MTTIELLEEELKKRGVFSTPLPKFINELADSIPNKLDPKMKLTIAVSEIILFASQFRRNIKHWNNSLIPINAITFCISGSGTGKDSSINAMRKNFLGGYEVINHLRVEKAKDAAKSIAKSKGLAMPDSPDVYEKFYDKPMPLFVAPSTNEGFIQYLNELDRSGIGAGFILSGEFGAELLTSPTIIANLQLLAELYDEGKKEVKVLKDKDRQSEEIKNLPVSALFMGSPENILFDETVKKKFKTEFTTKLARRSFFNFNFFEVEEPTYSNINELLKEEMKIEDIARNLNEKYTEEFRLLALDQINKCGVPLEIDIKTRELVTLYKKYNQQKASKVNKQYPITQLVIMHLYWKALKLAGALAIIKNKNSIGELEYKEAITFTELLNEDMKNFEIELVKDPYELFVGFCQTILQDNKCFVDTHSLRKMGYISTTSNTTSKLKDLANLASSYDPSGVYKVTDTGIEYTKLVKTTGNGVSYLAVSGSKDDRKLACSKNFNYAVVEFKNLAGMLSKDFAYSPFKFRDGIRNKSNIEGGVKWIALDIDDSIYTDEQMHEILQDYNHHIARTSDPNNPFKFRILLELDSIVDLGDKEYKNFIKSISNYLDLKIDILPKSQIYFSYSGRNVLSVIDKYPLETKDHIMNAYNTTTLSNPTEYIDTLSDKQKKALLSDPLTTFNYAFEAPEGKGSVSLYRAAKHAKDLGMSKEEVINLIQEINSYWIRPMDQTRLNNTLIKQIEDWSFTC